ncbi:MAG TPA: alpha/beta fold hydrolase [Thermoanaerobaculia bacterium]
MRLALAAFLLNALVASAAAPRLLEPAGSQAVGTRKLTWTDAERNDPVAGAPRQVVVQVWYPARSARGTRPAPYIMELDALRGDLKTRLRFDDPAILADVATHASLNAPIADRKLPVVLFSHGFGTARAMYTSFVRSLAAAGYFVAAIDHPGMGVVALEDRLATPYAQALTVPYLSADQRFVLDQLRREPSLRDHLDFDQVAMIGHSRGFLSPTCLDPRIKACVNLNGAPAPEEREKGLAVPLLTVRATRGDNAQLQTAIYPAMRAPAYDVVVAGSHHSSVTDRDLFAPHVRDVAERRLRVISAVVVAFLDQTLRGRRDELQRATGRFAEATLTVHGR